VGLKFEIISKNLWAVTKADHVYAKVKQKALVHSDKAAEAVSKFAMIFFFVFLFCFSFGRYGRASGRGNRITGKHFGKGQLG